MFDFGSTLGSGSTQAQVPRARQRVTLEWAPALKDPLYARPVHPGRGCMTDYWEGSKRSDGSRAEGIQPVKWRPEYPDPAFENMRADDALWRARLVGRFHDATIRSHCGEGSLLRTGSSRACHADVHIARRDKVLRADLVTAATRAVRRASSRRRQRGLLTLDNAAVTADVASAARAGATPCGGLVSTTRRARTVGTRSWPKRPNRQPLHRPC